MSQPSLVRAVGAHGGHPVLRWMAGNVSIDTDATGNWKPSKKKSIEKIDGIVALIMAISGATTYDDDEFMLEGQTRTADAAATAVTATLGGN